MLSQLSLLVSLVAVATAIEYSAVTTLKSQGTPSSSVQYGEWVMAISEDHLLVPASGGLDGTAGYVDLWQLPKLSSSDTTQFYEPGSLPLPTSILNPNTFYGDESAFLYDGKQTAVVLSGAGNAVVVNIEYPSHPLILSDPTISNLGPIGAAGLGAVPNKGYDHLTVCTSPPCWTGSFGAVVAASSNFLVVTSELDVSVNLNSGRGTVYSCLSLRRPIIFF